MPFPLSQLKNFLTKSRKSLKPNQLIAVKQCINYIKQNSNTLGLFLYYGSRECVSTILTKIQKGDPTLPQYLRHQATPRACATALNQFLRSLKFPILPSRIRELILGENQGIAPRIIALDALNLLLESFDRKRHYLLLLLMDMMKTLTTDGCLRPTEILETYGPYFLISIFFPMGHVKLKGNLTSIANILHEMILCFNFIDYEIDTSEA